MLDEQTISQLKSMIENAQSVMIVIAEQSSPDEVLASVGLHLSLRNAGRDSRLVSVKPLEITAKLPGLDQVANELGNENLTISFDYSEDRVDKVSYHIGEDTKKFYLTIKPKSGFPPLDTNTVEFSYTGASADLLILSGVSDLDDLQQLYYGYENVYADTPILTFGRKNLDTSSFHLQEPGKLSIEEWVIVLQTIAVPISPDAATVFLYGLESSTQGLSKSVSADTFDTVASLLRAGAKRMYSQNENPMETKSLGKNGVIKETEKSKKGENGNKGSKKKSAQG